MNNWKLRHSFTGNATSDVQTVNGYLASGEDNDFAVTVVPDGKEYAAPLFIPRTNLVDYSEGLSAFIGGATETLAPSEVDPTGNSGTVVEISNFQGATGDRQQLNLVVINAADRGKDYTGSLYVKGTSGETITYRIKRANLAATFVGSPEVQLTFDGTWQRIEATMTSLADTLDCNFYLINKAADTADVFLVWGGQIEQTSAATEYIPTNGSAVTRDWSAFGRVQNQLPGISNGTHTHTGAASGSGIAATTITGSGSGATFAYEFDTLGVLTTLTADGAGSGYKVGDKLSIDTTEGHTIEFRLVEGSNAATVSVSMDATRPNKPIPFPVSKMRVEGLTDRTVLFLDQRSSYVFPKPTPYLLDTYEGAAAAYSLRRLRSSYTGPAVRVRRASNNDELDIYFNADGSLDTATLEAFCAGTNGFVSVWYDQGQGGNDATQTSTASQPQIVSSGSVVTENGEPAIDFDGNNDSLQYVGNFLNSTSASMMMVAKFDNATRTQREILAGLQDSSGARYDYLLTRQASNTGIGNANALDFYVEGDHSPTTYTVTDDSTHLFSTFYVDTSKRETYDDGVLVDNSTRYNLGSLDDGTDFVIGADVAGSNYIDGKMQEVILYNSDQSANRTAIEDNINEHYGIYP